MPFTSDGPPKAISWMPLARTGNPWLTIRSSWRSSTSASSGSFLTGSRPTSRAEYPWATCPKSNGSPHAIPTRKPTAGPSSANARAGSTNQKLCTPQPARRSSWPYPGPGLKERRGKSARCSKEKRGSTFPTWLTESPIRTDS